jgi:cellulose synthase/poly-beta-1,6-N-acetylglucosamine synthase-like glycosyltransferase
MRENLSVIIPAHNEEKYIEKTIISLYKNNFPFELIIVCDSCLDNTKKIAKKYTSKVYEVDFRNISKTRNFGAKKCLGNVLIFNDADTLVSKDYLKEISKGIKNYDYGCAKWRSESKTIFGKYISWTTNRYNKKHVGGNMFVKRSYFDKVNGYREDMLKGEDTDFGERLKNSGARHCLLKNCWIIPSERKYKEQGYLKLLIKSGIEGRLYVYFRKYYDKKIASPKPS